MSRKLFDKEIAGKEESSDKEYKAPEEELIYSVLIARLLNHYRTDQSQRELSLWDDRVFKSEVETLKSLLEESADEIQSQDFLDALTFWLKGESDRLGFGRGHYLTAVIQALYDLQLGDEFVIDITNWPQEDYFFGMNLQGTQTRHLTLNLHGDINYLGYKAKDCKFTVHGAVKSCHWVTNCEFTFHDNVEWCGVDTYNCKFYLMPGAEILDYYLESSTNRRIRLDENGKEVKAPFQFIN